MIRVFFHIRVKQRFSQRWWRRKDGRAFGDLFYFFILFFLLSKDAIEGGGAAPRK